MPKKSKNKPGDQKRSTYAGESGSTDSGRITNPLEPASEDVEQSPSTPTSIPIGLPITAQEYRRLKERAGKTKTKDNDSAQEDPAAP